MHRRLTSSYLLTPIIQIGNESIGAIEFPCINGVVILPEVLQALNGTEDFERLAGATFARTIVHNGNPGF